jgi:riboflavin kinase/FMN adenylyltransferase
MEYTASAGFGLCGCCVAAGDFDGLHLGHRAVLARLTQTAREKGLPAVLLSFDRDCAATGPKRLTTEPEKRLLLENSGIDKMISLKTEGMDVDSPQFLREILLTRLGAKALVAGEEDPRLAALAAAGAACVGVPCETVALDGEPVTSRRAALALERRDFPLLARLLGGPYLIYGEVVFGKMLGRTVGMPTANISFPPGKLLPPDGVYAAAALLDGLRRPSLVNIGRRPSVDAFDYVTVETLILDREGELYGRMLRVELQAPLRGVKNFGGLAAVKAQVDKDILALRRMWEEIQ